VTEPDVRAERQLNNVELQLLTERMARVAENVYWLFFHAEMGSRVHAFIEFCGVLNKYVQICRRFAKKWGVAIQNDAEPKQEGRR